MTEDDKAKVANQPDSKRILIKHQVANHGKVRQTIWPHSSPRSPNLLPTKF